jgi:glycosyltransferase involved in cell wall biosynthesis
MPTTTISDAEKIRFYYRQNYGVETTFIPYGAETGKVASSGILHQLGLEPGEYFLYVSRMEPENNALLVRQAFESLSTDKKLALIGDAPYAHEYISRVRDTNDARVVMPGSIYGDGYKELQSQCFAYIHATEVGGTHPALIEAMGRGALTLYLDTPENREVAGDVAIPFTSSDLAQKLQHVLTCSEEDRAVLRAAAEDRVKQKYSWDAVTDAYERVLGSLLS